MNIKELVSAFNDMSIRYKIWLGFGIVLFIFVIQGLNSLSGLSSVHDKFVRVANEVQPAVMLSAELESRIENVSNLLGQFLLTKEKSKKDLYIAKSGELVDTVERLNALPAIANDEQAKQLVTSIDEGVTTFNTYQQRMIELAENDNINIIAIGYASENINPLNRELLQLIAQMLQSEEEEDYSKERAVFLKQLNDLRYSWANVMNELRLYLAFKAPAALDNFKLFREQLDSLVVKIEANNELFTLDQEDSFQQFVDNKTTFFENWGKLVEKHGSEQWRTDSWLIKTEIGPLLDGIKGNLKQLVELQKTNIENANQEVGEIYRSNTSQFFIIAFIVIGFVAGIAWMLANKITHPLSNAVSIANNIAGGNLENEITANTQDETGKLLHALSEMQAELNQNIVAEREAAAITSRIKTALDNVSANVLLVKTDGVIMYANEAVAVMFEKASSSIQREITDFNARSLEGRAIDTLFRNDPVYNASLFSNLNSTYESEFSIDASTFRVLANPVMSADGERLGTVIEWEDRTETIAVEREVDDIVAAANAGDLEKRIDISNKDGFFLQLSQGINAMLDIISNAFEDVVSVMSDLSEGKLTETISTDYDGTFGKAKDDVNSTVIRLREVIGNIRASSEQIQTSSEEISTGNNNLSRRTEDQAATLQETASSMEELTSTVKNNADNAQQANQLAGSARATAEKGGEVVSGAILAMQEINTSSTRIAEIIGVIDEIAFQTNLLALNASVEAARAGEQGRGFAVVATEVRNLAGRSATAAKEIKELINESVEKVGRGSELVNESGSTLEEIVVGIKKVGDIISEIAAAGQEQSMGIDQVNQAVTQLDEMTQQNAAMAEQIAAASESASQQARDMTGQIGFFVMDESGVTHKTAAPVHQISATQSKPSVRAVPSVKPVASAVSAAAKPVADHHDNEDEWEDF